MASGDAYVIDPANLHSGWSSESRPVAVLAFDDTDLAPPPVRPRLPPFPLIGIGDPKHPWARFVDTVVEPPVSIDQLITAAVRQPHAAAVLVQTLRSVDHLPADHALIVESLAYGLLQGSAAHAIWRAQRVVAPSCPAGRIRVLRDGDDLRVVIDRPAAHNAIDRAMRDGLFNAFTIAALDPAIEHVFLRSTGRAFCIGAELLEFGTTIDPATAHHIRSMTLPAHPLASCGAIVDVHVQGGCIGAGVEMAAFAGRVTASPTAWFQLPELAMGLIPGAGGCVSVPRRIGRQRAALMMLSGRRIDAATALRWRLIDAIVNDDAIDPGGLHSDGC